MFILLDTRSVILSAIGDSLDDLAFCKVYVYLRRFAILGQPVHLLLELVEVNASLGGWLAFRLLFLFIYHSLQRLVHVPLHFSLVAALSILLHCT